MQSYRKLVALTIILSSISLLAADQKENINLYQNEDYLETEHSAAEIAELGKEGDQSNLKDVDELAKGDDLGQKKKKPFRLEFDDSVFDISNRIRIDGFYGVNLKLINDANNDRDPQLDKTAFPGRHTMDTWFLYTYGSKSRGYDVIKFRSGIRNRAIWGDETSILPTSRESIRHVDAVIGEHQHTLARHVIWFREIWLEFVLNDIAGCGGNRHTVTMGLFPFALGRGITLGEAYEVDPDFLGYFATNAIDQYAPAFKLSGELIAPIKLTYDLYAEIADNTSNNFDQVNEEIKSQQTRPNRLFTPQRGFGVFDYILAARLQWRPLDKPGQKVHIEPYAMYVVDKEQRIEFTGDAKEMLGTFGLAAEFEWGKFEAGFDTAFNVGKQTVFAWDRNYVTETNKDGVDTFTYTKIVTSKPSITSRGKKAIKPSDDKQLEVINSAPRGVPFNGKEIPDPKGILPAPLFNSLDRFSHEYENELHGAMFVYDMAYNFPCVKVAATAGFATGDNDPNKDIEGIEESSRNKRFHGFIGEQEIYSGKRVRSLLVMAGPSKVPRLVSIPALDVVDGKFSAVTRFTNLILTGAGLEFKPKICSIPLVIKPNALGFWAWHTPRPLVFEGIRTGEKDPGNPIVVLKRRARNFLGTELNFTLEAELLKDLTYTFIAAGFFPGSFFDDVKGTVLSKEELEFLKNKATPNQDAPVKRIPRLGNDTAYYIQMTMEYKF